MIEHAGTCPTIRIQRENETSQAGLRRLRSARAALPIPTREEEEHGGFLGYNQKGMDVAKGALKGILNLKFDSGPCQADFAALSKAADKTIDANAIDAWANEILNSGTLYDGDTSNTTWSVANFGGTQKYGSSPPPSWTVGAEFVTNNVLALSQATGSAIWVKSGAWQSFAADYAQGTLIHEIIHKFGVNDGQMAGALVVSLAAGSEVMSRKLRDDCVRQ